MATIEFKGIAGKIAIDGKNVVIKPFMHLTKVKFTLDDILTVENEYMETMINFPDGTRAIKINIFTKKNATKPYEIMFQENDEQLYKLYSLLVPKFSTKKELFNNFVVTRTLPISRDTSVQIRIDDKQGKWYCGDSKECYNKLSFPQIYNVVDIYDVWVDIKKNSNISITTTNDGFVGAIVGGLIAGLTGAIIGSTTGTANSTGEITENTDAAVIWIRKKNDGSEEQHIIYCGTESIANNLERALKKLMEENTTLMEQPKVGTISPIDELRKYKLLLDDGIITQEDFDVKKKQLLEI